MYGCVYHHKRGAIVCKNDVVIRQELLDAAFLDAMAEAIDERLLARAVTKAVDRLQRRVNDAPDQRAALARERDRTAAGVRHLVDAVKLGRATDTLLRDWRGAWRPWRRNSARRSRRAGRTHGGCYNAF